MIRRKGVMISRTPGHHEAYTMGGILQLAHAKPQEALRVCQKELAAREEGYRKALYRSLAVSFVIALTLRDRPAEAEWLLADAVWGGKRPKLDKPLLVVLKWLYQGFAQGANYERARSHAKALSRAFEEEVQPAQLEAWIKGNGGLDYLARHHGSDDVGSATSMSRHTASQPLRHPAKGDTVTQGGDDEPDGADDASGDDLDDPFADTPARPPVSQPYPAQPSFEKLNQDRKPKYPGGLQGLQKIEILGNGDLFVKCARLKNYEGLTVYIYRVDNGDSAYIRLEAELPSTS